MRNTRLDESKLESRLPGEISITSDMQMTPPLRQNEKVGLKLNIQKTKIMAAGPITFCQIDGESLEKVADFIFLGSKITADRDCSHKIINSFLLGRKAMRNLDRILKSRDITLLTKVI